MTLTQKPKKPIKPKFQFRRRRKVGQRPPTGFIEYGISDLITNITK